MSTTAPNEYDNDAVQVEAGHHQVAPEDEAANVAAANGAHDAQDASSV